MKTLLIGLLALVSMSAFADEFCGQVSKISTGRALIGNALLDDTIVQIGANELRHLTDREVMILTIAKSNSVEVCVTRRNSSAPHKTIELR